MIERTDPRALRQARWSSWTVVLLVLAVLHVVLIGLFFLTKASWYEKLDGKEVVHFWTEFCVAYGTIVLAVVTAGSVFETHRVIVGEDRRFQLSRMPIIKLKKVMIHTCGFNFVFENKGDGPALDVRFTTRNTLCLYSHQPGQPQAHQTVIIRKDVLVAAFPYVSMMGEAG